MKGRKPIPTAIRILQGNPAKRPLPKAEPHPPALDPTLEVPEELADHPVAAREWVRLAPMLKACRQVTEADRGALLAVCLEWDKYMYATRMIARQGMVVKSPRGWPGPNPYIAIATKALAGCNKLWPELGLTPSGRTRVKLVEGPAAGDAFSEFDTPAGGDPMSH